jgi:hypothetical protein
MPAKTVLLANLAAGQTWTDSVNGIQLTNQGVAGTTAMVAVGFGGASCVRQAPSITATPVTQTAASGTALGYTLTVQNNDSSACPGSTFNLAQTLPAGFSGNLGAASVSLAPGASSNVGWNVTSATGSTDATYTLTAAASNTATASRGEVHTAYVVSTPLPPPTADKTLPTVSIASPADGTSISGRSATIAASASDNVGVASVQFYIDGKLMATDTSAPYSFNWNLRKAGLGAHTIAVRATDAAGNAATQSISVTVN